LSESKKDGVASPLLPHHFNLMINDGINRMSKKPHYRVGTLNKLTDEKGTVGGAWINDD